MPTANIHCESIHTWAVCVSSIHDCVHVDIHHPSQCPYAYAMMNMSVMATHQLFAASDCCAQHSRNWLYESAGT